MGHSDKLMPYLLAALPAQQGQLTTWYSRMNTATNSQPLAEFGITALHGERNVRIPFDGPVKIIVAENGFGKTTILNLLYGLIFENYRKLRSTEFQQIYLKFKSGNSVTLDRIDFSISFEKVPNSGMLQHLKGMLSLDNLQSVYEAYQSLTPAKFKDSQHFLSASEEMTKRFPNATGETLIQWLEMLKNELGNVELYSEKLQAARKIIRVEFPFEPIYLPTYRRIEEELRNLTGVPVSLEMDKNTIQFGMNDVRDRFDKITAEIKNSSVQWFAKINGQMLGQLIKKIEVTEKMKMGLSDKDALRIVLERIGDNMSEEEKTQINQLIKSGDILNQNHEALAYFLANLVQVYEQQKVNDNAIKQFTERSNKYLVNKHVVYDESAVEISIRRKRHNDVVDIKTLSSGEKQIISLFARLFLTKSKQVAIFFDEPELSLSIEWQKHLLPDLLESGICGFLFCTTHSPFIFENELVQYTSDLAPYIEEL
ncbi:MAG: ATP/GTP-binding protein [Herminiimonas sp.]|nr:ATP/GTP-binding protein [Herminiimonas sp.]